MDGREWFSTATAGFLDLLVRIDETDLALPGLGEWDVRALLGHSCRAFTTLETYLSTHRGSTPPVTLDGPVEYFRAARARLADPGEVTQRGRDAGAALGEAPIPAAAGIVERVTHLVAQTPDDAVFATPVGGIRLSAYLPTRAFEVTVHGIDLARAAEQPVPEALTETLTPAIALCAALAEDDPRTRILEALTGRGSLPRGFTVL